jgi:hypothetical protein
MQFADQFTAPRKAKDMRLPEGTVESRHDLHERAFGSARIEIGYAERDANGHGTIGYRLRAAGSRITETMDSERQHRSKIFPVREADLLLAVASGP